MTLQPLYNLPDAIAPAKRLARLVLLGAAIGSITSLWAATQFVAHCLGYDPILGAPLVPFVGVALPRVVALVSVGAALLAAIHRRYRPLPVLLGLAVLGIALSLGPVFQPLALLRWYRLYSSYSELGALLLAARRMAVLGAAFSAASSALVFLLFAPRLLRKADVFGSARWATTEDLRRAELLGPELVGSIADLDEGVFLGLWPDRGRRIHVLRSRGLRHTMVVAPTRGGKGVGLVVPNLLTWPGSVVVHDMKGENWQLTAGFRARELGSRCLRWDVTSLDGPRWNPLAEVRPEPHDVRDAQNISEMLVDPAGLNRERTHWERTAHALLTGLILHVVYAEERKTLERCVELLSPARLGQGVETSLKAMIQTRHLEGGPHPIVASYLNAVLDKEKEERSGVISTALTFLDLYRDPLVARNTGASDFRLDEVMKAALPLSLYVTVPPSDIGRTRPVTRLFLNLLLKRLTERLTYEGGQPVPHYRHRLLLMMDEFPQLGRLQVFQEALAFMAGYGVQAFLVAQSLSQLYEAYGTNESITDNCHNLVALTPNNRRTAEALSALTGQMTVHLTRVSRRAGGPIASSASISPAEHARKLMTADEVLRIPLNQQLLFATGAPPARALRALYYKDAELLRRAAIPPPA